MKEGHCYSGTFCCNMAECMSEICRLATLGLDW